MKRPPHIIIAALILEFLWYSGPVGTSSASLAPHVTSGDTPGEIQDPAPAAVPVWRFWSPVLGGHFYTIDEAEKDYVSSEYEDVWTCEGVAYRAFLSNADDPNLKAVHRFWSGLLGAHFYTIDETERDYVISAYPDVWVYEGVAFFAYPAGSPPAGTTPIYRFWSGVVGAHFYTASDQERFKVLSGYGDVWQYEGIAWYAYPADEGLPASIVKGPYLQQVTSDSATIMWETDVVSDSRVDYGMLLPTESSVYDPMPVALHKAVLAGLDSGTTYTYRVTSAGAVSPAGSFMTAPPASQPFRFVVYGDSRTFPATHAQVVQNIIADAPALVFNTGDLVGVGRDYSIWQPEFFEPLQDLMMTVPVVPVLGNHEYGGVGPLWFFYFFDLPLHEGWWAMTYGNTRIIGLDTNAAYTAGSRQNDWLMQEFASAAYRGATWHVVIFHHPPFSSTTAYSDNTILKDYLVPLLERHGVDVAFQGHSHVYERYLHNGIHYIVTGGGGAPLYPLVPDITPPIRQFGLSVYHHCVVDVDPSAGTLTIRAIDITGRVFDAVELSKSP